MPCKPRMTACKASCLHYLFVRDYQQERERQYTEAVERSGGYDTEMAEELSSLINFKKWLTGKATRQW